MSEDNHDPENDGLKRLLHDWLRRAFENQHAHYQAYEYYSRLHYYISLPVVILTSIVGTTVFATLQKDVNLWAKLAVASISVAAAVLSGLQAFLRYSERSEKHRTAANGYGAIRRKIELWLNLPTDNFVRSQNRSQNQYEKSWTLWQRKSPTRRGFGTQPNCAVSKLSEVIQKRTKV